MSYTALYRKFRPDTFSEVKGQDHIVTVLKNQIRSDRVGHAYLFCGTRGTGKTSVAKIFAKAINCEHPVDGSPCNECATCKSIQAQTSMNVIEIDAASNNGVDNIREIVDEVRYSPTEGRYKVYIIDEVHMLSAGAFNALLKTLEEPPAYVVFILATTEVHKIPVTILSRCQRYDFKRIPVDLIVLRLKELTACEHVEAEDRALRYIAGKADGAFRDAISLLDQCIAFCFGEMLTYDRVLEILGAVDIEVFAKLLRYVRKGSVADCVNLLDEIILAGRDLTQFITDFAWYLRNLLLVKTADDIIEMLEISTEQTKLLQQEAKVCDTEILMRYIRIFSELSAQIRFATQKRVLTELALVRLCCPEMETDNESLVDRIRKLESRMEQGQFIAAGSAAGGRDRAEDEALPEEMHQKKELPAAVSDDLKAVAASWPKIVEKMPLMLRTVLISACPTVGPDDSLLLMFEKELDKDMVEREKHLGDVIMTIEKTIGKTVVVRVGLVKKGTERLQDFPDISKIFKNVPVQFVD